MKETSQDIKQLNQLLEQSIARAGTFLRKSFQMPNHSLSAAQLVKYFQGLQVVALATTTIQNEPRVAPVGALFYRGSFYIPTVKTAARTKHIRQRPAISLSQYDGVDFAIIIHGNAKILTPEHPDFAPLDMLHQTLAGGSVLAWGEGVYLHVEADRFFTFARFPEEFPS